MVIIIIVWLVAGAFAYAMYFAEMQATFPSFAKERYREDMGTGILFGLFGVFSFVVIFFATGFAKHGLKWK